MSPEQQRLLEAEQAASAPYVEDLDESPLLEDLDEDSIGDIDVRSSNTVHDKHQFESAFDFDLKPLAGETRRNYDIDFYLFIPVNMGINPDTYTRDNFYKDLTNYLRIKTPRIAQWSQGDARDFAIPAADRYFRVHLTTHARQRLAGLVVQEVKLFGCFVNHQLKRLQSEVAGLRPAASGTGSLLGGPPQGLRPLKARLVGLNRYVRAYRSRYLRRVKEQPILMEEEVKRAFLLVDEYISYRLEAVLIAVSQRLAAQGIEDAQFGNLIDLILGQETRYRRTARLINLERGDDQAARLETYYYRLGLLKKYVNEVLYLQVQHIKKERVYRNLIAAFGAGLAATWATWADLQRMQMMTGRDTGLRLGLIIFIAVTAYIFKDRIKELTREYFNERLKHHLPDYDMRMHYTHLDEHVGKVQEYIGNSREFMFYLSREALPADIAYIRHLGHRDELDPERNEVIVHYSRRVAFRLDLLRDSPAQVRYIKNVLRFDISEFLGKLDDPNKRLQYYDADTGIETIKAPKVYHINAVFRYAIGLDEQGRRRRIEHERVRIILNKKGILRVEEVLARGEMGYVEGD